MHGLRGLIEEGRLCLVARDGRRLRLRGIRPEDAGSMIRGYDALSDEAKWFRMLHAMPHLSGAMARALCSPDPASEICLVIEGEGPLAGEIVGGARLADMAPGAAAEFSVSLRPEMQGQGLARGALELAIAAGREAGCTAIWGVIARRNRAMLRLAGRIGFTLSGDPDDMGLIRARLELG